MERHRDLRRHERRSCGDQITVVWRCPRGDDKFWNTKALDISELGMRVQMLEALPRQSYVIVRASTLGLVGQASVRHCSRIHGGKFSMGLEFASGMRWAPKHKQ